MRPVWTRLSRSRAARWALALAPILIGALALWLCADDVEAQRTGGSFGGGSFGGGGGGGGGSSGGGYSGGGSSDGGDGILTFIFYVLLSRLPWPLKIGLVGIAAAGWFGFRYYRRRSARSHDDPE